jgi:hypothetical protein
MWLWCCSNNKLELRMQENFYVGEFCVTELLYSWDLMYHPANYQVPPVGRMTHAEKHCYRRGKQDVTLQSHFTIHIIK